MLKLENYQKSQKVTYPFPRFQVSYLPRTQWLSRNTVNPACCSVTGGRPLGHRKQIGSFNERRELRTLSWRERIERGCHATLVQGHCTEGIGTRCVLEGPLADCHIDFGYIVVGTALTAVRNSAFCEGSLLSDLNEALVQTAEGSAIVGGHIPPCSSCPVVCAASILSEVADLCSSTQSPNLSEENKVKRQCLVFGSGSVWGACEGQIGGLVVKFSVEPSCPVAGRFTLHDGEPQYQQELVGCVLLSLRTLAAGDALLLPLISALTRVSAAVILCLHLSFRSVTFTCPPPPGVVGAVLVCVGFCPEATARLLPFLTDLHGLMGRLAKEEESMDNNHSSEGLKQVLQFVPMEELLRGPLTEFLWAMNSAIVQQRLHLLMQA